MKSRISVKLGALITFVLFSLCLYQCKRPRVPRVEITVRDIDDQPVQDATVRLYCVPANCVIDTSAVSNVSGFASFEFKLPGILRVSASKNISWKYYNADSSLVVDSFYTLFGESSVTLEMDVTTTETVVVVGVNPDDE